MSTISDTLRVSDMDYLFEVLNHAASPIVINVATLAASKGAVVKSTAGRVKAIAKRYGLEITTTTKGDFLGMSSNNSAAAATPAKATTTRKRKAPVGKTKQRSEDGEDGGGGEVDGKGSEVDEEGPAAKKGKKTNGKTEQAGTADEEDAGAADGEDAGEELA